MAKLHSIAEQPLEEESYFVSMTDMMVGLLFIFILMLMYFALQYQKTTEQLTNANKTRGEILVKIGESLKSQGFEVEINPESGILRLFLRVAPLLNLSIMTSLLLWLMLWEMYCPAIQMSKAIMKNLAPIIRKSIGLKQSL
jgi:hypothetical protein